jgi:hypothetical protein
MSEFLNLENARQTLRTLTVIALEANRTLYDGLKRPNSGPTLEQSAVLNRILEHLTQIREGFILALRTPDHALASELRDMIQYLVDWTWLNELGLRWQTDEPLARLGGQTILYQHAIVALGMLPRLPTSAVTYPHAAQRGAYADIPIPSTPGEMLTRIQELEDTIWAAASEPVGALSKGAVRRTYGFFEATTWLIANHLADVVGW